MNREVDTLSICVLSVAGKPYKDTAIHVIEVMPRYPEASLMGCFRALDYAGTMIFAVSGAITAATSGMSLLGCTIVGSANALGGGTIRDLIWGRVTVHWLEEVEYIYISIFSSVVAFCVCAMIDPTHKGLQMFLFCGETLGLSIFSVIGTMYAARIRPSFILCLLCCFITCCGGGIIRDILCRRPARILHAQAEIYAEAAMAGGSAYLLARSLGLPLLYRALAGSMMVIVFRLYASYNDVRMWTLPQYRNMI
eukprot:Tbor_TRINITY_DN2604_c0_g1::TRINITY_DN2604_c0_g1_i1::g.18013::m.18013